eukprot:TRINITY_DN44711_c0_g1_i1.p1 TRINITY_DN44711_c0_g1~~TRINITY_DN44711_c0_g1_i1.p1  ORF type:complete len:472 (-),score=41.22 TRINITY_DN44711_c0_g1_i1:2-1360(-)
MADIPGEVVLHCCTVSGDCIATFTVPAASTIAQIKARLVEAMADADWVCKRSFRLVWRGDLLADWDSLEMLGVEGEQTLAVMWQWHEQVYTCVRCCPSDPQVEEAGAPPPPDLPAEDCMTIDGQMVTVRNSQGEEKSVEFDAAFGPEATQQEIFRNRLPMLLDAACEGYNGTVIMVGAPGSGKSHTLFGSRFATVMEDPPEHPEDEWVQMDGLVFQSLRHLDMRMEHLRSAGREVKLDVSFLSCCENKLRDLLRQPAETAIARTVPKLQVRDDRGSNDMTRVSFLTWNTVSTAREVRGFFFEGIRQYRDQVEALDEYFRDGTSFVFSVRLAVGSGDEVRLGTLRFVRIGHSRERCRALIPICPSGLESFERLIYTLMDPRQADQAEKAFRNSAITHLLRQSLGGPARTIVIGTCFATADNAQATWRLINLLEAVKDITNNPDVTVQYSVHES